MVRVKVQDAQGGFIPAAVVGFVDLGSIGIRAGLEMSLAELSGYRSNEPRATGSDGVALFEKGAVEWSSESGYLLVEAEGYGPHRQVVSASDCQQGTTFTCTLHPAGAIHVLVTDRHGTPLPGARLKAELKGQALPESFFWAAGESDSGGQALLAGLQAGRYSLRADCKGFAPNAMGVVVAAGDTLQEKIQLRAGYAVYGRVVDQDGTAVIGALIKGVPLSRGEPQWLSLKYTEETARSDQDGVFELHLDRTRDQHAVMASKESRWVISDPVQPEEQLELVLPEAFRVQARILTSDQQAASGASLSLLDSVCPWASVAVASERANDQGMVEIRVPRGEYGLAVVHDREQFLATKLVVIDGPTQLDDVQLSALGSVSLRVLSKTTGLPIPAARAREPRARSKGPRDPSTPPWREHWEEIKTSLGVPTVTSTDEAAEGLLVTHLSPGPHLLVVSAPGFQTRPVDVVARAGEVVETEVVLSAASELLVHLQDSSGDPVVGQPLLLLPAGGSFIRQPDSGSTDETGDARFRRLEPGAYEVRSPRGASGMLLAEVEVAAGVNECTVVFALLQGVRVFVARAGEPCSNYAVQVLYDFNKPRKDGPRLQNYSGSCLTDEAGFSVLPGIPAGDYLVHLQPPGGMPLRIQCTLYASGQIVEIHLPEGLDLSGLVIPPTEGAKVAMVLFQGLDGISAQLLQRSGRDWLQSASVGSATSGLLDDGWITKLSSMASSEDGSFSFADLPAGSCLLQAFSPDGRSSDVFEMALASSSRDGIRLELRQPATVTVGISHYDEACQAHAYRNIRAQLYTGESDVPYAVQSFSARESQVQFKWLPDGEFRLQIRAWTDEPESRPVTLAELPLSLSAGRQIGLEWDGLFPNQINSP